MVTKRAYLYEIQITNIKQGDPELQFRLTEGDVTIDNLNDYVEFRDSSGYHNSVGQEGHVYSCGGYIRVWYSEPKSYRGILSVALEAFSHDLDHELRIIKNQIEIIKEYRKCVSCLNKELGE